MDVRTVLLGVEERDKWRRRLATLEGALRDVRSRRERAERRLKTLNRQLARLGRPSGTGAANAR
jgi:predicted  nucleic acid-binding Zn-ribbon protein